MFFPPGMCFGFCAPLLETSVTLMERVGVEEGGALVQTDHILVEVGGRCRQVTDAELLPSSELESHSPPNQLLFDSRIHLPWIWRQAGVNPQDLAVNQMSREDPVSSVCQYRHRPLFQQHSQKLSFPGRKKTVLVICVRCFPTVPQSS